MTPAGRFDLPLLDFEVKEIAMSGSFAVTLQHAGSGARAVLSLLGAFRLERPAGSPAILDPTTSSDITEMLRIRAEAVTEAFATIDGTVSVHFADGHHLIAPPAHGRPSWELAADRFRLAARLTGGLEIHPVTPPRS